MSENQPIRSFGGNKQDEPTFTIAERAFSARSVSLPEIEMLSSFTPPTDTGGVAMVRESLGSICPFLAGRAQDGEPVTVAWLEQTLTVDEIAELLNFIAELGEGSSKKVQDVAAKGQSVNRAARRKQAKEAAKA